MQYYEEDRAVDGNAAAGSLAEVFSVDMTSAQATCADCGATHALAQVRAFLGGPGTVLRCSDCNSVLGRIVRARDSVWLDLRGVTALQIPVGAQ